MNISLSTISIIVSLMASFVVPIGAYYSMKSDIRNLTTQVQLSNEAINQRISSIQSELAEIRQLHYQTSVQINKNKIAIAKIDTMNKKQAIDIRQMDKMLAIVGNK